jgi:hypothetical protein
MIRMFVNHQNAGMKTCKKDLKAMKRSERALNRKRQV